ncbi:hypothetical protein BH11PLA2_BH11PLA2_08880 [soil metagenome]
MTTTPTLAAGHPLLTLALEPRRHLWIGQHPPFPFESVFLPGCTNFRGPPSLHRGFDVVWCYEINLNSLAAESVPLYLDEAIRFLGEEGDLVLRYTQTADFTIVQLKRHLGRHPNLQAEVTYETQDPDGTFTTVVRIRRLHLENYASNDWTFAILTQGTKVPNVVKYLKSIRDEDHAARHEILICGPRNEAYDRFGVNYVDRTYSTKFADICAKKNDLAKYATKPNLLIVHDRYVLDRGFLDGFDEYGSDFDFVTVTQRYESGEEFPSYCALSKTQKSFQWIPPIAITNVNAVYPLTFLNGGLLAFKTHNLRALPFNDLLFWNQAEDVDLSRWMYDHSLPPRVNLFSSATVLGLTPAYTSKFRTERKDGRDDEFLTPALPKPVPFAKHHRISILTRGRRWLGRHFRKLAAVGLTAMLLLQVALLYLIATKLGLLR